MDEFKQQLGGGGLAPGNLLHAAGSFGEGCRALDVFESRAAADQVAQQVGQLAGAAGLAARSESEFEIHKLLRA